MISKIPWPVFALPAIMSGFALLNLPYGYYQLLRIIVSACAVWVAYKAFQRHQWIPAWVFLAITILVNPIAKIHMERETHAIFNIVTAILFLGEMYRQGRLAKKP